MHSDKRRVRKIVHTVVTPHSASCDIARKRSSRSRASRDCDCDYDYYYYCECIPRRRMRNGRGSTGGAAPPADGAARSFSAWECGVLYSASRDASMSEGAWWGTGHNSERTTGKKKRER